MAHLYLAATRKSSGKTTLSIGLTSELRRRGRRVQPFKKGPDYIDPLWLSRAAGRSCLNLDYHTMVADEIRAAFAGALQGSDLGFVEGNVGLFDSVDLQGVHSNAELSKLLGAPLVLVVDVQGMGRGIAPLLLGYQAFDPALTIAGVILNKAGGGRHESNLRRVVEHYTDLPVLGCVPRAAEIGITERHLGLIPSNEAEGVERTIECIRVAVAAHCDVDRIEAIADAAAATAPEPVTAGEPRDRQPGPSVRIAIARDDAFGFYYPDDLAALERAGAELIPFSPVWDDALPDADALLIGGGFPECRMQELDANRGMRAAVADFIAGGGPAYAECGGLMYLTERLHWNGRVSAMCGVLGAEVAMHERPRGRGYVRLRETPEFPWSPAPSGPELFAHEFHHSAIIEPDPDWRYGYEVLRGTGIDERHDGIVQDQLLASYAHLRDVGGVAWTRRFVDHIRSLI
jgi:cobyrinic acid a,c-diamide synthase